MLLSIATLSLSSCKVKKNTEVENIEVTEVKNNIEEENIEVTEVKNEEKKIALMVSSGGCAFELKINGTVVLDEEIHDSYSTSFGIEHHLVEGDNVVEVTIDHPDNAESNFLAKIVLFEPKMEEDSWDILGKIESVEKNSLATHSFNFKTHDTFKKEAIELSTSLFFNANDCDIEVSLNDILIKKERISSSASHSLPVDGYIVGGENSLKIKVIPLENKQSNFDVKLASFGNDTQSFFDESSWNHYVKIDSEELSTTKIYDKKFIISKDYKMTWETAPKIELNKETIKKIDAFMEKVYIALENKRGEDISYLYKYKHQDLNAINSKYDVKVWENMNIEGVNSRKDPLIKLKKGEYTLEADGRLVSCVGRDGMPLIRCLEVDGYGWSMPMRIGLVDGEFYILL